MEQPKSQSAVSSGTAQLGIENDSSRVNEKGAGGKTTVNSLTKKRRSNQPSYEIFQKTQVIVQKLIQKMLRLIWNSHSLFLDSWSNDNDRDSSREMISSPIRAEMRTGLRLAKNGQYQLDLSDKELQNNFVKWLDMLADQNEVSFQQVHLF